MSLPEEHPGRLVEQLEPGPENPDAAHPYQYGARMLFRPAQVVRTDPADLGPSDRGSGGPMGDRWLKHAVGRRPRGDAVMRTPRSRTPSSVVA